VPTPREFWCKEPAHHGDIGEEFINAGISQFFIQDAQQIYIGRNDC